MCTVKFYRQMIQSNSFNENYLIFLLNWDWPCLKNKFSLIRNLNLFVWEAGKSKWSESIVQLHSSNWLFNIFKAFSSQSRFSHMLCSSSKKLAICFTITSNLTVRPTSINKVNADRFLKCVFITTQKSRFTWWSENSFNFAEL